MRDLLGALVTELEEEAIQRRLVAALGRPDQTPAVVVQHHDQVALPAPPGDLVDPDPAQAD